jgi:hypothetical protein
MGILVAPYEKDTVGIGILLLTAHFWVATFATFFVSKRDY